MSGEQLFEIVKELPMDARTVVLTQWKDLLEQGNGAAVDDQRGPQHHQTLLFNDIRPVHEDEWLREVSAQRMTERTINAVALLVQMRIGEQPVDAFNIVLARHWTAQTTAERGHGEESAFHQRLYCAGQCNRAGSMQSGD